MDGIFPLDGLGGVSFVVRHSRLKGDAKKGWMMLRKMRDLVDVTVMASTPKY